MTALRRVWLRAMHEVCARRGHVWQRPRRRTAALGRRACKRCGHSEWVAMRSFRSRTGTAPTADDGDACDVG